MMIDTFMEKDTIRDHRPHNEGIVVERISIRSRE
jgi:hypothetical protein